MNDDTAMITFDIFFVISKVANIGHAMPIKIISV